MSNYLIQQGQRWHVKVAIPADVQHLFGGKKAFKQTLKTTDKAVAIARSGPLVVEYKRLIEEARGYPTRTLDEYLEHTQLSCGEPEPIPTQTLRQLQALKIKYATTFWRFTVCSKRANSSTMTSNS